MAMGITTTLLLLVKIKNLEEANSSSSDIDINIGFQLFALGALVGAVDYLGGIALSYN
jgi:hypothetical protein